MGDGIEFRCPPKVGEGCVYVTSWVDDEFTPDGLEIIKTNLIKLNINVKSLFLC